MEMQGLHKFLQVGVFIYPMFQNKLELPEITSAIPMQDGKGELVKNGGAAVTVFFHVLLY
jgi:hypothetical protein